MLNTMRIVAIAAAIAGVVPSAWAQPLPPQDQTSSFIDSGRYIDGQVPPVPNYERGR
jgi:hypothetical protein